jgi:predicted negative regulator of RcsB-dependent stress response
VAGALAEVGQHEQAVPMASQAETMARSVTDLSERTQALTAVAAVLAQAGQHEQAETVARSITDPGWQVDALAEVGRVLVARGDTRRAQHVASAACAVGRWTKVLDW